MTMPKFLYHGTSTAVAEKAIKEGLHPRSAHGKTNWKHTVESNPDAVYLTDAYPLYFALNCDHAHPAIIQIDVSKLDTNWIVPDEDVLEQAGRGHDNVKGNMKQRTRWYRKQLSNWITTDNWQISLKATGTCGSLAPIPAEAISRVAFIDYERAKTLCMAGMDASIMLANYRFCGTRYRNLTNRIFGLPTEADPLNDFKGLDELKGVDEESVKGIKSIIDGRKAYQQQLIDDIAAGVRIVDVNAVAAAAERVIEEINA